MKPLPREVAAIHEAGHAVVGVVLKMWVTRVDIKIVRGGREGLTSYRPVPKWWVGSRDQLARRGATALGGMAAEWIAAGKVGNPRLSMGDLPKIMTLVYEIAGVDPPEAAVQALWDKWLARAVAILEARWPAVEAVAAALVRDGEVERTRLLDIIGLDRR